MRVLVGLRFLWVLLIAVSTTACLDIRFGQDGFAQVRFEHEGESVAVRGSHIVVHEDGRVFGIGSFAADPAGIAIAAFLPDGTLDEAFAEDGTLTWRAGGPVVTSPVGAFLQNGMLTVVSATATTPDGVFVAFLRVDLETGEVAELTLSDVGSMRFFANDAKADPDGNILVSGCMQAGPNTLKADTAVARFTPDFVPDSTFGTDGVSVVNVSTDFGDCGSEVHLAGEHIYVFSAPHDGAAVLRFTRSGTLDPSFGQDGLLQLSSVIPSGESFKTASHGVLAVDVTEHRLLVAGALGDQPERDFGVVAISTHDFERDVAFGVNGIARVGFADLTGVPTDDLAGLILLDHDGRIVVTGVSFLWSEDDTVTRLSHGARLTSTGAVEIDANGHPRKQRVMVGDESPFAAAFGLRPSPHRGLVFLGRTLPWAEASMFLARYY